MLSLLSMLGFMLIPIWIPLLTSLIGAVSDAVRRDG